MRASILAIALLVAIPAVPGAASAWCRMTSSRREPSAAEPCIYPDPTTMPPERFLAWQRPCSGIVLSVDALSDDLEVADVIAVLNRSIATWEAVDCGGRPLGIDIRVLDEVSTCTGPLYRDGGGNANTLMFVSDWGPREYDPAAYAVTTVWHRRSTGEILDVDIEVNERRGPYGVCPPEGCLDMRLVDLENVLTHELGHYLGLAHSTDLDATMYASAAPGETTKRDLADDDVAGICEIYPEGSLDAECDFEPANGLVLHCQTGCSVSATGRDGGALPTLPILFTFLALVSRRRR